jgi:hypothetical protein
MVVQFKHTKTYRLSSEPYKSVSEATKANNILKNNSIKGELMKSIDSTYRIHIGDFLYEHDANQLCDVITNHFIPTTVNQIGVSQKIIDSGMRIGSYILINRKSSIVPDINFDKLYQIVSIIGDDYNVSVDGKIITFKKSDLIIKKNKK